jgi:hypothetical protein
MLISDVILAPAPLAQRPQASSVPVGSEFCAVDSIPPYQLYRSNGQSWDLYAPSGGGQGGGGAVVPPYPNDPTQFLNGAGAWATGPVGPAGPPGDTGPQGPQGPSGSAAPPEVAVNTQTGQDGLRSITAPGYPFPSDAVISWQGQSDLSVPWASTAAAPGLTLTILNQSPANRILWLLNGSSPASNAGALTNLVANPTPVAVGGWVTYRWTGGVWVLVGHEQGAWITPAFSSGNFFASGGTWTVGSASADKYLLRGRTLWYQLMLGGSSIGGTPGSIKRIAYGFTAQSTNVGSGLIALNAGTMAYPIVQGNGLYLQFWRDPNFTNWAAGNLDLYGMGTMEVA